MDIFTHFLKIKKCERDVQAATLCFKSMLMYLNNLLRYIFMYIPIYFFVK